MSNGKIVEWEDRTLEQKYATKLLCENSFLAFHKTFFSLVQGIKWRVNWHHKYMSKYVEDMILGKMQGKSLIISVPPGSGKTETLSIHGPAWSHLVTQRLRNMHISYSKDLVTENSERVKGIINETAFQDMWSCSFGKNKCDNWTLLDERGRTKSQILSRSMGGQITGGRGGYPIPGFSGAIWLDDPDKPADMFSKVKREKQQREMVSTVKNRRALKSKDNPTPFIIIQQRLHIEDTTGFILNGGFGKSLYIVHIKIPALIDQEYIDNLPEWIRQDCIDSICHTEQIDGYWSFDPSFEDINKLMEDRNDNQYYFASQYMQEPIKLGGNLIKEDWWKFYGDEVFNDDGTKANGVDYPHPPAYKYRFITGDTASKTNEWNDYTVFCEWGVWDGKLYLIDMLRGKWSGPDVRRQFLGFFDRAWNKNSLKMGKVRKVLVEDASSATTMIQEVDGKIPIKITGIKRTKDKFTRALDANGTIEAGNVILPHGAHWVQQFVCEHSEFSIDDSHKNDDMCDNTFDAIDYAFSTGASSAGINMMLNRKK